MHSLRNIVVALILCACTIEASSGESYDSAVKPILKRYCFKCHGEGDEVSGEVDFTKMTSPAEVAASFVTWEKAIDLVVDGSMPPEGELQPTADERSRLSAWYHEGFVNNVEVHPGFFKPRRLAAYEYRNTLQSVLGFELEVAIREAEQTVAEKSLVMKLLPTDPPGASGFTNDTSGNPLTTVIWDQYSYLVDNGLEKLFSTKYREELEALVGIINGDAISESQANTVLRTIARRAYRRTVHDTMLTKSLDALKGKRGKALETALRTELKTILMSPAFMYRGLLMDVPRDEVYLVDDFELAERLSYFFWADMPDDELMRLAEEGTLRNQAIYRDQMSRMLASDKARSLALDFGTQWFSLNEIDHVSNNPPVADALKSQPLDFVHYLFAEGRPIVELVDADFTFINPHTAKYYPQDRKQMAKYRKQKGIEVERVPNQLIKLGNTPERGGLLTMPGILAMNKGPVLRGTWILERILGDHLPEPPADVGQVQSNKPGENLTFRERFEQHRSNATCAVCHDKIDPLGFGLGAYDVGGGFTKSASYASMKPKVRKRDASLAASSKKEVDTSGKLPSGETFDDFAGLKQILATSKREVIIRNVVRRTMSYALCRKLELYDRPTVEAIVKELNENDGTFHDLVYLIATSLPFQKTVVRSE